MEEVTDSSVLYDARLRRARFDRNYTWFQAHVANIYAQHRGKCICVAGEMLFVADTPQAAINQGRMAHPDDSDWFCSLHSQGQGRANLCESMVSDTPVKITS